MSIRSKTLPPALADEAARLEAFRKNRKARILPDGIWHRAAALARQFGRTRTAKVLRLDYGRLKKELEQSQVIPSDQPNPTFVELPAVGSVQKQTVDGFSTT